MKIGISLPVRELQDDVGAIKAFAQAAEELGLSHLRVPEQIIRPGSGPLHEPLTLMALIAGATEKIELVPSVIILPARQTVLVAKQAATLDRMSGGRLRLGVGIGRDKVEYDALGMDFHNRGARCEEQIETRSPLRRSIRYPGKNPSRSGGACAVFRFHVCGAALGVRRMAGSSWQRRKNSPMSGTMSTGKPKLPGATPPVLAWKRASPSLARANMNGKAASPGGGIWG